MLELQSLTTLRASTACYGVSFTFTLHSLIYRHHVQPTHVLKLRRIFDTARRFNDLNVIRNVTRSGVRRVTIFIQNERWLFQIYLKMKCVAISFNKA
jgi:hypothetical protein